MDRHDEASGEDYEQLRRHVQRVKPEHPAAGQQPRAPAPAIDEVPPVDQAQPTSRLSVMEWLVAVGHVVARKLRRAPGSAMIRIHPKE
jgi:hypothetical protein